jgi:hypothetical protein|tara:strand:- start:3906 stop:4052 length:147 start_codon:yes stop_codon:yes gene_type:complete
VHLRLLFDWQLDANVQRWRDWVSELERGERNNDVRSIHVPDLCDTYER